MQLLSILNRIIRGASDEVHEVLLENRRFFEGFDQSGPITQYEFTVFDTELTGLNIKQDEIVSIGAVRIRDLKIVPGENFHCYVRPKNLPSKEATLVHRITMDVLHTAPPIEEILPQFVLFCHGSFLVGHYVALDVNFLNKALKEHLGGTISNPCIDTMKLAQVFREEQWGNYYDRFNYQISFNLEDLAKEYGLPNFDPHDALEDAYQTAYLFLFLVKKFRSGGLTTMKDLYMAGRNRRWIF